MFRGQKRPLDPLLTSNSPVERPTSPPWAQQRTAGQRARVTAADQQGPVPPYLRAPWVSYEDYKHVVTRRAQRYFSTDRVEVRRVCRRRRVDLSVQDVPVRPICMLPGTQRGV